jgi:Arc/MetJ-type ribon-helix-helix transcriptional regulator
MINYPTMPKTKVAITLDSELIDRLDKLVKADRFPNRSRAIEVAVREKLERLERGRLARECAKLNPNEEQAFADEGLALDRDTWPEY